jgi:hypothetical protein
MAAQAQGEDRRQAELARRKAVSALMPEGTSDATEMMIYGGLLP